MGGDYFVWAIAIVTGPVAIFKTRMRRLWRCSFLTFPSLDL
jgi:hypothetical protein